MVLKVSLNTGINRIILEFKVSNNIGRLGQISVLIESYWNLKILTDRAVLLVVIVLIE